MTTPGQTLRSRLLAPALGFALASLALASFGGCFVSFDGYELADAGGSPDAANGDAGTASGGHAGSDSSTAGSGEVSGGGTSSVAGNPNGASGGRAGAGGTTTVAGGSGATSTGGTTSAGGSATTGGSAGSVTTGGNATTGGSAGSATTGGSGGALQSCPIDKPELVPIPRPDGGIFCIDRTEVTNANYAAFLATNPSTTAQSAVCTANASFAPAMDGVNCTQYDPTNHPNFPVACVSWCDAQAYCAWAGKRLCGKIGGGANLTTDFADATKSEWYTACSRDGQYEFPYGGTTYQPATCVGQDEGADRPTAVPTPSCQGGYDGVFDMSGNVSEWEDSCVGSTGLNDLCLYRGGSYADLNSGTTPTLQCNSGTGTTAKSASKARSTRDKEIGFRCCADP